MKSDIKFAVKLIFSEERNTVDFWNVNLLIFSLYIESIPTILQQKKKYSHENSAISKIEILSQVYLIDKIETS